MNVLVEFETLKLPHRYKHDTAIAQKLLTAEQRQRGIACF